MRDAESVVERPAGGLFWGFSSERARHSNSERCWGTSTVPKGRAGLPRCPDCYYFLGPASRCAVEPSTSRREVAPRRGVTLVRARS